MILTTNLEIKGPISPNAYCIAANVPDSFLEILLF